MDSSTKRKAEDHGSRGREDKRVKGKKQWRVPRKLDNDRGAAPSFTSRTIEPGDSGIWATCQRGREAKCIGELRDLFGEHAERLYGKAGHDDVEKTTSNDNDVVANGSSSADDIEKEIEAEIADLHRPSTVTAAGGQKGPIFVPVKLGVQCVVFFKTNPPIDPVPFVKTICEDAHREAHRKRTRAVQRLSPMTRMGRASLEGLEKVAREVLAPYFHQEPSQKRKFAIRPSLRNHNIMTRETIIKSVATIVGPGHVVDLKNYELLILVEVYQNVCGIGVVDADFEKLKRYNLSELFDPSAATEQGRSGGEKVIGEVADGESNANDASENVQPAA